MSNIKFSINGKNLSPVIYRGGSKQFTFIVDNIDALGGKDIAASHVEHLLAGYAGSLNVAFNLIAKERNIIINELKININGNINPANFLRLSQDSRSGFLLLNVHIHLQTNSNENEEQELIYAVKERNPISDDLRRLTRINYFITTTANLN